MNSADLAKVLAHFIAAEPTLVAQATALSPFAAALPSPFNALSNPLVTEAVASLPKLMPFLTELETLLTELAAVKA